MGSLHAQCEVQQCRLSRVAKTVTAQRVFHYVRRSKHRGKIEKQRLLIEDLDIRHRVAALQCKCRNGQPGVRMT